MKLPPRFLLAAVAVLAAFSPGSAPAAEPAAAPARIGIYDSRAVAYAQFWSPAAAAKRAEIIAEAKAAKAAGDTAGFDRGAKAMTELQRRMHEQVFGPAPATDAFNVLAPRAPALRAELGVDRLVSKWDEKELAALPAAARIDVTDRLVREFLVPDAKQQRVLESLKTSTPVPLWKLKAMQRFKGD